MTSRLKIKHGGPHESGDNYLDLLRVGNIFGYDASDSSVTRVEFMIRPRVKLAEDRNNTILAGLRNTNCRISRYMDNKSSVDCHEPTSDLVEDLDATAQQQSGQNP